MNAEWITKHFTVTDDRLVASKRAHSAAPKLVKVDGATWLAGTDGHIVAAVPFDGDGEYTTLELYPRILARPTGGVTLPVAALREWVGAAEWPEVEDCTECDGTGEGLGECECLSCGNMHEAACDECGGDGYVVKGLDNKQPATLLGVPLNKALLARLVEGMPDGDVVAEGVKEMTTVRFAAPDDSWRAVCIGIRDLDGRAGRDVFDAVTVGAPVE